MRGLLEVASTKYLFRGLAYSAENTISRQWNSNIGLRHHSDCFLIRWNETRIFPASELGRHPKMRVSPALPLLFRTACMSWEHPAVAHMTTFVFWLFLCLLVNKRQMTCTQTYKQGSTWCRHHRPIRSPTSPTIFNVFPTSINFRFKPVRPQPDTWSHRPLAYLMEMNIFFPQKLNLKNPKVAGRGPMLNGG